jgi:hypothetical protein
MNAWPSSVRCKQDSQPFVSDVVVGSGKQLRPSHSQNNCTIYVSVSILGNPEARSAQTFIGNMLDRKRLATSQIIAIAGAP